MKILIVEDDSSLGKLFKDFLERMGEHEVIHVTSGKEAVRVLKSKKFDCAFINIQLEDTNGIEILRYMKTVDPAVPVIMMSGYPTLEISVKAMRLGASDLLIKPFSLQDVMFAFERALRERQILLENLALKLERSARLELARVNKELEKHIEEQKNLFLISSQLDEVNSSEGFYETLLNWTLKLTGADMAGLYVPILSEQGLTCESILLAEKLNSRFKNTSNLVFPKVIPLEKIYYPYLATFNAVQPLYYSNSDSNLSRYLYLLEEAILKYFPKNSCKIWHIKIRGELFAYLVAYFHNGIYQIEETWVRVLDFLLNKAGITLENLALYESLMANFYAILRSLVNALEARDLCTGKHSERVTKLAVRIARHMDCSHNDIEILNTMGYLHDIGKIGIPDAILSKSGDLTSYEHELIKQHPVIGESIVKDLGLSKTERSIIRHHHERWDGKGYPDGIGGTDIPFTTRIICVADAYDAMSTDRPYRKPLIREQVINELKENKGTQFDPKVVDALLDILKNSQGGSEDDNR